MACSKSRSAFLIAARAWGDWSSGLEGTGLAVYLPKTIDWVGVLADVNQPIVITEGELKAACAAQQDGKTTVLEMMVTAELGDPFRRDALSLPVRHLAKYQSTVAR